MKGFHKRGGAQWANLGGQTLQLKWLVNCKDPMHDCNRFLWQILHTTGEHWTGISKCIYWMLNPRRWTHQITKYWRWTIRHLYWSECTTRAPSSGEKANKFASQIKQFFCDTYYDTQFDTVGNEEITKYKCKVIKCWIQNEWCNM